MGDAERLKKLRLTMTTEQYRQYHGLLGALGTAQDGKMINPKQRLFVAERVIAEKPVSIKEAMEL